MIRRSNKGLTLAEVLLASAILAFALSMILLLFMNCILLNETSRNTTLAYSAIQAKMEEIKNTPFGSLDVLNGTSFNLTGFPAGTATGRITVTTVSSRLKGISIVACFSVRSRVVGDNIANCQTSPVRLDTLIAE
jgi:prepilin-type N-terminal cleavage/methylation domain-containing protein